MLLSYLKNRLPLLCGSSFSLPRYQETNREGKEVKTYQELSKRQYMPRFHEFWKRRKLQLYPKHNQNNRHTTHEIRDRH